ncbi:MAG: prepilin-type N-terminal cleavage/methylation domain-containing protein [Sedimentisphaerales bacterium]
MRRFAFTLVELLVTTAIIALIMTILVPVLRAARLQARSVICSSNIRQIQVSLVAYENQNGTFPCGIREDNTALVLMSDLAGNYPGVPSRDKAGKWWFQFLGYTFDAAKTDSRVLWCPSRCVQDISPKPNILCGNYGVNRAICKDANTPYSSGEYVGTPLGVSKISRPESKLLIVDSGYSLISWQGATDAKVKPYETIRERSFYVPGIKANSQRTLYPEHRNDAINGRHLRKTVNVGYADGHTKQLKAEELFVPKESIYQAIYKTWMPNQVISRQG